jgi:hypothetical protein
MARIFIDGFESGDFGVWSAGNPTINNSRAGLTGSYCAYFLNTQYLNLNLSKSSLYISFYISINGLNTSCPIISFYDSAAIRLGVIGRDVAGYLVAYKGNFSTLLGTGITVLGNGANWYHIEAYYLPHLTNGSFIVKADGVTQITATGVSTSPSTVNIGIVQIGSATGVVTLYYDNFVVDDANWIGNTKIQAIVPTGAGATTGWTPSTGDNYATVDEKPASDTDYVKTSSEQIDTYAMGNLTGSIASIKSVAVQSRNWREGNGSYDRGQHIVRPASTDRLAASKTSIFPPTAKSFQSIWELNPEDSAAWEEADVNGMEAGIKAVTA